MLSNCQKGISYTVKPLNDGQLKRIEFVYYVELKIHKYIGVRDQKQACFHEYLL